MKPFKSATSDICLKRPSSHRTKCRSLYALGTQVFPEDGASAVLVASLELSAPSASEKAAYVVELLDASTPACTHTFFRSVFESG